MALAHYRQKLHGLLLDNYNNVALSVMEFKKVNYDEARNVPA